MKVIFSICIFFLTTAGLYAQPDSVKAKPARLLTFHFSNGVNVLQSEPLRSRYGTKTLFYWGTGIRLGNPDKDIALVGFDYNRSSYTVHGEVNNRRVDSLLRVEEIIGSLAVRMVEGKEWALRARSGFIYCILTDKMEALENDHCQGFKIGLSLERKIFRIQNIHFDLDYDLIRPGRGTFRDYDAVKLGMGIYL